VSVVVCPLSIDGAEGVIASATRAELTVTVTVVEAVPPSESVTWTQYSVVDVSAAVV
jgi:hypothetical protein